MWRYVVGVALELGACVVVACLAGACASGGSVAPPVVVPPVVEPPPAAPVRVALTIRDAVRNPVPGLACTLTPDQAAAIPCEVDGLQTFYQVARERIGWGGYVQASAEGFDAAGPVRVRIGEGGALLDDAGDPFEITLSPARVTLPRLVPRGQYLQLETGERWTWIGASSFNLLNRFRRGEDIEPVLVQLEALGFNAVRVFTVYDICPTGNGCQAIGRSEPTADLYAAVPGFAKSLARHGLYAELVAFTGPYGLLPTDADKVAHWARLTQAARGLSNLTLELVNEFDHPANKGLPFDKLPRPAEVLASHGSGAQDSTPVLPVWDYATYRPGSGGEWMRKTAHNGMEDVGDRYGVPTVTNETTRFPDNDSNPAHAFDAAAGAALLSAGAVFHSVSGKAGLPWGPVEYEAARQWAAGARSVPLSCQGQPYRRTDDPNFLRVYSRGSDPACTVRIRR